MTEQDAGKGSIPYTGNYNGKQYEHELFSAIEDFMILSVFIWHIKMMAKHPMPALVFLAFGTAAVWSALVINHGDWYFYPLAIAALYALGRVIR